MKTRSPAIAFLMIAGVVCAEDLARKSKSPRETYPRVDVIYDSVTAPDGTRLRTIITKPRGANGKLPAIFVAGWLSCDSMEAPADTKDESGLALITAGDLADAAQKAVAAAVAVNPKSRVPSSK